MDVTDKEIIERITILEEGQKSLHKRVDHIEGLAEGVNKISVEMQYMREDLNKLIEKVEAVESRPAKRWDLIITAVISAIGGGIGSMIIGNLIH